MRDLTMAAAFGLAQAAPGIIQHLTCLDFKNSARRVRVLKLDEVCRKKRFCFVLGQNFAVNATLLYWMNCLSPLVLAQLLVLKVIF